MCSLYIGIKESESFLSKDPFNWFFGFLISFTDIFREVTYYINIYNMFNYFNQGRSLISIQFYLQSQFGSLNSFPRKVKVKQNKRNVFGWWFAWFWEINMLLILVVVFLNLEFSSVRSLTPKGHSFPFNHQRFDSSIQIVMFTHQPTSLFKHFFLLNLKILNCDT